MKDIMSYPGSEQIRSDADKISKLYSDWKKDPMHWTNNKRKLHGYCVLRGRVNRKDRFEPPKFMVHKLMAHMLPNIEQVMSCAVKDAIDETIEKFVDIRDVNIGDTTHRSFTEVST